MKHVINFLKIAISFLLCAVIGALFAISIGYLLDGVVAILGWDHSGWADLGICLGPWFVVAILLDVAEWLKGKGVI